MTDILDQRIETLCDFLRELYPARKVTRNANEVNEGRSQDLKQGLFCVFSAKGSSYRSTTFDPVSDGYHEIMIVARFQLDRDADGADVERLELCMVSEIKELLRQRALPPSLCGGELLDWQQSAQQDAPSGWVVFHLRFVGA